MQDPCKEYVPQDLHKVFCDKDYLTRLVGQLQQRIDMLEQLQRLYVSTQAELRTAQRTGQLARAAQLAEQLVQLAAELVGLDGVVTKLAKQLPPVPTEKEKAAKEAAELEEQKKLEAVELEEQKATELQEAARKAEELRAKELEQEQLLRQAQQRLTEQMEEERIETLKEARVAEQARQAEAARQTEAARIAAAEKARLAEVARQTDAARIAAAEKARLAEAARQTEAARIAAAAAAEKARQTEAARIAAAAAEKARLAEAAIQTEAARIAAAAAEKAGLAEVARQTEAARLVEAEQAETARKAKEAEATVPKPVLVTKIDPNVRQCASALLAWRNVNHWLGQSVNVTDRKTGKQQRRKVENLKDIDQEALLKRARKINANQIRDLFQFADMAQQGEVDPHLYLIRQRKPLNAAVSQFYKQLETADPSLRRAFVQALLQFLAFDVDDPRTSTKALNLIIRANNPEERKDLDRQVALVVIKRNLEAIKAQPWYQTVVTELSRRCG